MKEETKNTHTTTARKCLDSKYKQVKVNVRLEKYDIWKQYVDSKGTSFYALLTQLMDEAIEKDGFIPEMPKTEE